VNINYKNQHIMKINKIILLASMLNIFASYGIAQLHIPQNGLIAYYPFTSDLKDWSGNNYNGKATEAMLVGIKNKSCFFNGKNAFIEVSGIEPLAKVNQLSISCWICPFVAKQYDSWISKANDSRSNSQWRLSFGEACANQLQLTIYNTNWTNHDADFKFEMNHWYHITYLIDNTGHRANIYVNGQKIKSFEIGEILASDAPLFMGFQDDNNSYYCGLLDEAIFYNRLLTETEIGELYNDFKKADKVGPKDINTIELPASHPMITKSQLDSLDNQMHNMVLSKSLAGVEYMLADRDKVIHHQAIGYRNVERMDTLQKNSIFQIACAGRPFTAAAILMLAEKGLISIHDPISKYIPQFREMKVLKKGTTNELEIANREITIYDLLAGQSGIDYIAAYYDSMGVFTETKNLKEVVMKIASIPLVCQPGEGYQYGFTSILDYLIEVVTKSSLNDFLKKNLFYPLGMNDTEYYVPKEKINRLVSTYEYDQGRIKLIEDAANCGNTKEGTPYQNLSIVSTPGDYLQFARMLLNKGMHNGKAILSETSVDQMISNQLPDDLLGSDSNISNRGWGMFGWVANKYTYDFPAGTYGKDGGDWTSLFWMDPENEIIGIIFLQTLRNYEVIPDFYNMVYLK
jgi:CubicO group peptidase (beta-lactamase class C family)